jgi:hypothetical protein
VGRVNDALNPVADVGQLPLYCLIYDREGPAECLSTRWGGPGQGEDGHVKHGECCPPFWSRNTHRPPPSIPSELKEFSL